MAASPDPQRPEDISIRIVVKELRKRQTPFDSAETVVWHPLDRLKGYALIQSKVPLTFGKVTICLEGIYLFHQRVGCIHFYDLMPSLALGCSRVWIDAVNNRGEYVVSKSRYRVSCWYAPGQRSPPEWLV